MPGFENYREEATQIEREMVRKGVVLDIDWTDEVQLRALAREALTHGHQQVDSASRSDPSSNRAKADFFGLAQLMLKVMQESADNGFLTHGGPAWKAFGKALWAEAEVLGLVAASANRRNEP
ncbi:MAG: hypothetical protein PHQ05_02660 [Sterolibacterium sp.]|nr:hypothetical protein [Sterolibacterium sp.]